MGMCLATDKSSQQEEQKEGAEDPFQDALQDAKPVEINSSKKLQQISINDFELLNVLGRGAFGKVMLIEYKKDKRLYAIKIMKKDTIKSENQVQYAQNERLILETVEHPFIVQLHFAFQTAKKLYLITDFMIGGELFFHLRRSGRFKENRAKFYAVEIILALEYLHSKGVIYRDLKPENILLGSDGHVKLTDFGLSKIKKHEEEQSHSFCGTPEYLAPEILLGKGHNESADWWSLGALIYDMLTGTPPFYSRDKTIMYKNRLEKPIDVKSYFSEETASLLKGLLRNDPTRRLGSNGAAEIKCHSFFDDIDWEAAEQKLVEVPFKPKLTSDRDLRHFDPMFTDEQAVDTPVKNQCSSNDFYDKFTYMRQGMDSSNNSFSRQKSSKQCTIFEDFVELNPHFKLEPQRETID